MEYKALLDEAWALHIAKNAGYAGAENPDAWANFRMCEAFGVDAFTGCMVRLSDKYIRITNLLADASNDRVGESVRDTLQDLAAYALIAICLLDEKRPQEVPEPGPSWRDLTCCELACYEDPGCQCSGCQGQRDDEPTVSTDEEIARLDAAWEEALRKYPYPPVTFAGQGGSSTFTRVPPHAERAEKFYGMDTNLWRALNGRSSAPW
jgi:hypothetical protein